MNNSLKHRGPDDEGYLIYDFNKPIHLSGKDSKINKENITNKVSNLFLGHRRLAIIDLSIAGHQPMSDINQKLWIVFNGEIYNYMEIRQILQTKGYIFKTNTDTEVIINSYLHWGYKCVDYFDGMWAFVILDTNKNILWGSRDRFGVKPLYFYHDKEKFIFASEIKAIVNSGLLLKQINDDLICDYISMGIEEQSIESFFKNLFQLLPSHNFELNLKTNELKIWKYYDLKFNQEYEKFDKQKLVKIVKDLKELIFEYILLHLRADVSIGSCLSGGIDSSTIVCIINEILKKENISNIGKQQKVFSAVFPNEEVDETKWIQIVVNHTNVSWYKTSPNSSELFNDLEDLIYFQDIPFGSTSIYAQYRVMKLAAENGIKVMLDGQGGDEVFSGYLGYFNSFFSEIIYHFDFKKLLNSIYYIENFPFSKREFWKIILRKLKLKNVISAFYGSKHNNSFDYSEFLFSYDLINNLQKRFKEYLFASSNSLNLDLFKQIRFGLINLLRYEDRNSMRFSIEARTPFADSLKLIEYVFSLPSTYKIHNGFSKYILRESMKGIVPNEILNRSDKIGFQTPQQKWINLERVSEYLDWNFLKSYVNKLPSNVSDSFLWRLLNLSIWKKVFFS